MENNSGMPSPSPSQPGDLPSAADARAALDALSRDRGELANIAVTPSWYRPALAGLVFIFIAGAGSERFWVLTFAAYGVGLAWLVTAYRNLTGIWVSGWQVKGSRTWALVLFVVMLAGVITSLVVRRGQLDWWWALVAGAVAALTTLWVGPRFDRALRDSLRSGQ